MYHIYQIYKNDILILTTVSDLNPEYADTTKLDILLNNPSILQYIYADYFNYKLNRTSDNYRIVTFHSYATVLDAQHGLESLEFLTNNKLIDTTINTKINKTKKPRTKKVKNEQS